ncbi:TonB-dependent siderophore receptor [Herbaspirillum sp. RTI4]|uniref:TonB-dependent siderophore receptor n=1 Tax=Herbaspirillum sp. RTI4 TaxID=3048640 RepID=UPI002AB3D79F|nr:TonB-dependent siderophore receptor [Herbaspirillum sp. RTI4]MDY7577893.1 TonB-dependent siderophore receptor [Herbaspirillum sp. RTI4]MEA9981661.1 TonB-dependent siderophore receptor [Herbaspirillum sp. RTI4]
MQHFPALLRRHPSKIILAVASLTLTAPLAASEIEDTDPDRRKQEAQMDVVIVQGARASPYATPDVQVETLGGKAVKELPLSMQSYGSELIEAQASRTLTDVLKNDASTQDTAVGAAMDNISIRGFPVDWSNSLRRDGMPVAPYFDIALENTERVDVLKGPSGFLYGVNTPGGSVNYVLKRPTPDSLHTAAMEMREHAGRYTQYARIDSGGPFNKGDEGDPGRGYRLNLAQEKRGDFSANGDRRREFASLALDWRLSPDALLRLDADYQNSRLAAQPMLGLQPDGSLPPQADPRTLLGQPWLQYASKSFNLGARIDLQLNKDWLLTSQITQSFNERDAAFPDIYTLSANGTILSGDIYLSRDQSFRVRSTNTFVSGKVSTGALRHHLVAGLSSRHYRANESGFAILPITVGSLYQPVYTPQPTTIAAPPKTLTQNSQTSLFASDVIDIGPQWSVMLGWRHVRYRNDSTPPGQAAMHDRSSVNVPALGLLYKWQPQLSTYVSYAKGFEPGGLAAYNTLNAGQYLAPLHSRQWETGIKADPAPDLSLTAALFRIEKGLQYVNEQNYFVAGGQQRHTGLELNLNGKAGKDLSVLASVAWLRTQLLDTGDAATNGKRAANVPAFQLSGFADYRLRSLPGMHLSGGVYHVGRRALNAQNSPFLSSYTRFDIGARYLTRIAAYAVTLRAGIENLTDKRYWAAANYNSVWPGRPRTVVMAVQVDL